jgi:hypothetical protein
MPLNLSEPVDVEVYSILHGFHSAVECKNFLLSAVLYYSRSPLVVASNSLVAAINDVRSEVSFTDISRKLDEILSMVKGVRVVPDTFVCEESSPSRDVINNAGDMKGGSMLDAGVKSALASLKQSFKV